MEFTKFVEKLNAHFMEMIKNNPVLFEVNVDKDAIWELYLNSFPQGTNEIFRKRREFDCSCCKHFIRHMGNVVVLKHNRMQTIWDFDTESDTYQPVVDALNSFIKSQPVTDRFFPTSRVIGTEKNYELIDGRSHVWSHMFIRIPKEMVVHWRNTELNGKKSQFRDTRNVFKRSLDEISVDAVKTVLELISQNSLYRGQEWKDVLEGFLDYKRMYDVTPDEEKENFTWEQSGKAGDVVGRIRNHSMGILLMDISEGMDLDRAVKKYENIVAPANYKRPKALYTQKMLDAAKQDLEAGGYLSSLARRFANLDDISINNVLFANRDAVDRMSGKKDIFAQMSAEVSTVNPKKFSKIEEIAIEKFISDVLPSAQSVEVLMESRLGANLCSLIAPENKEAKSMFKWNNPYSWAYAGNIADSQIRENVKAAGGSVTGDLRFSIQWNEDGRDNCDLDAHAIEPERKEIYYGHYRKPEKTLAGGQLDVDIISPNGRVAVENITWPDRKRMKPGVYQFFVKQFSGFANKGFRAEIEFDGAIYSFDYSKKMRSKEIVNVAEVTLNDRGEFSIKELIPSVGNSSKEIWNIKTNQFVPVSVICYSPNYWDEQTGLGNKHYMFMLKECVNPETPNGIFNEYLKEEFMKHRHVLEALGAKLSVEDAEDQLSGLGFSSTKRNELIVKVKGQTERILKIKF